MVGSVIVSHSKNLVKSVVELVSTMASNARIAPAGGMDDGGFGTSFEKIQAVIEPVYSDDGVLVPVGLGSAVMTTEMVIEMFGEKKVETVDCPLVGDAVVATIDAMGGMSFEDIKTALAGMGKAKKFQRMSESNVQTRSGAQQ